MVPGGVDIAMGSLNVSPHVGELSTMSSLPGLTRQSIIS
jgi:hypothetical protein